MAKSTADRLAERAVAATLERIRRDAAGASEPVRTALEHLAEGFFKIGFHVARWRCDDGLTRKAGRSFRAELGVGPKGYLLCCKREMAEWLLRRTDVEIWRVGTVLGYSKPRNFSRDFADWTGVSPSEYRLTRTDPDRPLVIAEPTPALGARIAFAAATPEEVKQLIEELQARFPADEATLPAAPPAAAAKAPDAEDPEWRRAEELWRKLRYEPPEAARERICREAPDASPALFELLSRKSREEGRKDRRRGIELAELALAALEGAAGDLGDSLIEHRALGHARLGNALRLAEDFPGADEAFARAWELWSTPRKERDCRIHAEVCFLEGTLRLFQRRLDEALDLLNRAIALARVAGDSGLVVRSLLQRVSLFGYRGDFVATVPDLRMAQSLLESLDEPLLDLVTSQNLATACALAGDFEQAAKAVAKAQAACEDLDHPLARGQLELTKGLIARGQDQPALAETLFRNARLHFIELGELDHAAGAALELAALCHEQGRSSEALGLASELIPVFEAPNSRK